MKQLFGLVLSVAVAVLAQADTVTSAYHVKVANGDVFSFETVRQTTYPSGIAQPIFWLDCSETNGWEFANGTVTKACSRVGNRYLTPTKTYVPVTMYSVSAPLWSVDPELGGGVIDFGETGSYRGLYFDPCAPEDAPNKTNVLWNIRTVISVIDSSAGGGWFLGGGSNGTRVGYPWHRGSTSGDSTDPYLYAGALFNTSHAFAYAQRSRYWIDDVPNDPAAGGFSGGWAVTALEPEPEPNPNGPGNAWGIGINDARQSSAKLSGGFKVAEMLIYDKILTKAETDAVRAYLNAKWLKRTWRGYDGHAGFSWIWSPNDASVTELNVAANDTLETDVIQGGRASGQNAAGPYVDQRLIKTGAGAITFPNAANYNGVVELKEGSILVKAPDVAVDEMPKGLVARFDASDENAVETDEAGAVTKWTSSVANAKGETYCLIPPAANRAPMLTASPLDEGKPVVDFGAYAASNGRYFLVSLDGSTATTIGNPQTILAVVDRNPGDSQANIANGMFGGHNTTIGSVRPSWFGLNNGSSGAGYSTLTLSEVSGPSYVNGVRHDPTNGVYHGGYSVVAKTSPRRYNQDLYRVGSSEKDVSFSNGGGFRLAELLVFNRPLTDREIRDLSDRLSVKWLGRHTDAYRAARTTADIQKLDVSGETSVKVEEGATVRVGSLGLGAKLIKEGAGTLEIERFRGKYSSAEQIEVRGGEVKIVGPSDPGETAVSKLADNPSLHLDAADADKMLFDVVDGEKRIVKWYDENLRDAAFQPTSTRRPFLNETDLQNGHPVIDFGPKKQSAGGRYFGLGRSYDSVRAAYVVFMQSSDQGSAVVLGSSPLNGDNGRDCYDFVRSAASAAWNTPYFNKNNGPCHRVCFGAFYTNGVAETSTVCYPPLQEFRLVEIHTLSGAHVSGLASDRAGASGFEDTVGGCRIGEVVLYERELTEREKIATRNYLMKKWFDAEPQALPDPEPVPEITRMTELTVPAGETKALDVDSSFVTEFLTGAGTLVKSGAGTLTVADVSGFAGTLAVAGGTIKLTGAAPDETATLVTGGRILHMDASQGLETETNGVIDVRVKTWKSLLNDGWTAVPFKAANGTVNPPEVIPCGLAGRNVVEMGAGVKQALEFQKDGQYAYLGNIHSIFWVIGSQNGGGFLMGGGTNTENGARYPFHRYGSSGVKASDALMNYSHAYAPLKDGTASWYMNGVKVAPTTTGLSGGWDLLSMTIPASTPEAYNYVNAQGFAFDGRSAYQTPNRSSSYDSTVGNQRLAEVIIYDRELTEEERISNEHYLQRKWRLGVRGAVKNDATLALDADGSLDCGGVSQYFAAVCGSGSVANGTLETDKVFADTAETGLTVQGTFVIPENLTVEFRNLPAEGDLPKMIPILQATEFEGLENLTTAVFTGSRSESDKYRLVVRSGILKASLQTGMMVIVQ